MDARYKAVCVAVLALCSVAATDRSRNFVVTAPTHEIAKQIAQQAELCRHKLAVEWLGKPLPNWRYPCIVNVKVGQIGAGGATTFVFNGNSVSDYKMNIQGPLDRLLDSVVPHEVNHTIFAEFFRRPLPRWADEGAATFVEDESERRRQMQLAMQVLRTNRRIPMRSLLSMMDYPRDMNDTLHLYAEGYVLTELLIQNGGRAKFLNFLNSAHKEGWDRALHAFYNHRGTDVMEQTWSQWVLAGCPSQVKPEVAPEATMLASNESATASPQPSNELARSQAPDREPTSVEDLVVPDQQVAVTVPRRGAGLQAPRPNRRLTEPEMLKSVELGSGTGFAAGGSALAAKTRDQVAVPRVRRDVADTVEPPSDEQSEIAEPRSVKPQPRRPVTQRSSSGRGLMTPKLPSNSRLQLGQARPFPAEDAELYADAAG